MVIFRDLLLLDRDYKDKNVKLNSHQTKKHTHASRAIQLRKHTSFVYKVAPEDL